MSTETASTETKPVTNGLVPQQTAMISNVAEIFNAAGFAFKKLSDLVQQLDNGNNDVGADSGEVANNSHWDQADVEQFHTTIQNFNDGLTHLAVNLKNKMSARLQQEHLDRAASNANSINPVE